MNKITAYTVTVWNAADPFDSIDYDVVAKDADEACAIAEAVFTEEEGLPVLKSRAYETGNMFYCKPEVA